MMRDRGAPEPWDFSWMTAAIQSMETYGAALETAEFPSLLLAALDELMQAPEANATQLQELADVLLQMVEFPIDLELPRETVTKLHSTRDWAIQTLLDIQAARTGGSMEDALQAPTMSKSLQQMQTKLFVSAPCRMADVQVELHQLLLAAMDDEEDADTVSDVLEMCATRLEDDNQFLQFAESALIGKSEALTLGSAFLQRLFERRSPQWQADEQAAEWQVRRKRRLFDELTLESRIRVWANHLPSWRLQLERWMLEAHRAPFEPITTVMPGGWMQEDILSGSHADTVAVKTACRRYSHLYVAFVEWCRCHLELLASSRSMEVVSVLSRSTRPNNAARLFSRELLQQVSLMSGGGHRAFVTLGSTLQRLQTTRNRSDIIWQYEWIGILERPYLLHEALEVAFSGCTSKDGDQAAACSATEFFGWFYSYSSVESAGEIAALLKFMSSELKVPDIRNGAQWLRRSRANFETLPILRLRLVWFWLLKSIDVQLETCAVDSEINSTSAMTDVLESVEYIFRRFTPPSSKRAFQVELVTQLLVELEWRTANSNVETRDNFLDGIASLCAWLTKIVRLMHLEEQTTQRKENRSRHGDHKSPANDVKHLAERLEQFSC